VEDRILRKQSFLGNYVRKNKRDAEKKYNENDYNSDK
jgi:hypothetical protein